MDTRCHHTPACPNDRSDSQSSLGQAPATVAPRHKSGPAALATSPSIRQQHAHSPQIHPAAAGCWLPARCWHCPAPHWPASQPSLAPPAPAPIRCPSGRCQSCLPSWRLPRPGMVAGWDRPSAIFHRETWAGGLPSGSSPLQHLQAPLAAWVPSAATRDALCLTCCCHASRAGHSPFSQAHARVSGSRLQLAQAMTEESDNEAARTVLAHLGGTAVLERFARDFWATRALSSSRRPTSDLPPCLPPRSLWTPLGMQVAMARLATSDELLPASRDAVAALA